jgi:hypothetical protein
MFVNALQRLQTWMVTSPRWLLVRQMPRASLPLRPGTDTWRLVERPDREHQEAAV